MSDPGVDTRGDVHAPGDHGQHALKRGLAVHLAAPAQRFEQRAQEGKRGVEGLGGGGRAPPDQRAQAEQGRQRLARAIRNEWLVGHGAF